VVTVAIIVVTAAKIVVTAAITVVTVAITAVTVAITAVTAAAILNLILLIPINPLVQKVGKIEVMGTLLRILNMKVAGVGEKGEFQMEVMLLMMKISNPFL
jgi:hypothetical protein